MITCAISGFADLSISHLVLDYNGALAFDGVPITGVRERLERLSENLEIHVVTADTFGRAARELADWPLYLTILTPGDEGTQKETYVQALGAPSVAAVGNGRNDARMLGAAALGMGVLGPEGAAAPTLVSADVMVPSVETALDLLLHPDRLKATLRV